MLSRQPPKALKHYYIIKAQNRPLLICAVVISIMLFC